MDILTFSVFIGQFTEVCKHFHVRFNDGYVSTMCEDGTWRDLSYEQFKDLYISSFIETMLAGDKGGDK